MNQSDIDFQRSCRLCLTLVANEECRVPLFEDDDTDSFIMPCKIYACLAIMVYRGDPFSSWLCSSCYNKLNEFDLFKRECTVSDLRLKQQYQMLLEKESAVQSEQDEHSKPIYPDSSPITSEPPPLVISSTFSLADNVLKTTETKVPVLNRATATITSVNISSIPTPIFKDVIMQNIKLEPIDDEEKAPDNDEELTNLDHVWSNEKLVLTTIDNKLPCTIHQSSPNVVTLEPSINRQEPFDNEDKETDTDEELTNLDHFWSTNMSTLVPSIKMEPPDELENGVEEYADNVESKPTDTKHLLPFTKVEPIDELDLEYRATATENAGRSLLLDNLRSTSDSTSLSGIKPKILSSLSSSRFPMVEIPNGTMDSSCNASTSYEHTEINFKVEALDIGYDERDHAYYSRKGYISSLTEVNEDLKDHMNDDDEAIVGSEDRDDDDCSSDEMFSYVPLDENVSLAKVSSKPIIDFSDGIIIYRNHKRKLSRATYKCTHRGCTKAFRRLFALRKHRELHIKPQFKHHVCCICPLRFSGKDILKDHEESHFLFGGTSPCKYCGLYFATLQTLKYHCKVHTKVLRATASDKYHVPKRDNFECTFCGTKFRYFEPFKKHYTCCQQGQSSKALKDRNIKCMGSGERVPGSEIQFHQARCTDTCSNGDGEEIETHPDAISTTAWPASRPFKCGRCLLTFASESELDAHSAEKHSNFLKPPGIATCSPCRKSFENQSDLIQHEQQVHNVFRDAPKRQPWSVAFSCNVCEKVFPQKGALICHQAFYHREEVNRKIHATPNYYKMNYKRPDDGPDSNCQASTVNQIQLN